MYVHHLLVSENVQPQLEQHVERWSSKQRTYPGLVYGTSHHLLERQCHHGLTIVEK